MTTAGATGSEETLRDGRVVVARLLRVDDTVAVAAFWRRLDTAARRRFLDLAHLPPEDPSSLARLAPGDGHGIVAIGPSAQIVGIAHYERAEGDTAEFSVFVDTAYRREDGERRRKRRDRDPSRARRTWP